MENIDNETVKLIEFFMMVTSTFINNLTSQTRSILENRSLRNSVPSGKLPSHQIHYVKKNKKKSKSKNLN